MFRQTRTGRSVLLIVLILAAMLVTVFVPSTPARAESGGGHDLFTDVAATSEQMGLLDLGSGFSCQVNDMLGVRCWGFNASGQLGDGTNSTRLHAVTVTGLNGAVGEIAVGDAHACALITTGDIQCWGDNTNGQLGDGSTVSSTTATTVTGLSQASSSVSAIAAGGSHSCALFANGAIDCWGANSAGQLGDGSTTDRPTPVNVGTADTTRLALGQEHTCVVTFDEFVWCVGEGSNGQLGHGAFTSSTTPVQVTGLPSETLKTIAAGGAHTCAVFGAANADEAFCWGANDRGQLGDGTTTGSATAVAGPGGLISVTAGMNHTCGLVVNGNGAYCWGAGAFGESWFPFNDTSTFRLVAGQFDSDGNGGLLGRVASIAAGDGHTCLVRTSGYTECMGWNPLGQLGNCSLVTSANDPGPRLEVEESCVPLLTPPACPSLNGWQASASANPTVVGWWPFDTANPLGQLADGQGKYSVGVANGGAAVNPNGSPANSAGQAQSFDGSSDVTVDPITLSPTLDNASTVTIETWVQTTDNHVTLLDNRNTGNTLPASGWTLILYSLGGLQDRVLFQSAQSGGTANVISSPQASVSDGNWHRLTVVRDANETHLFLDGTEIGSGVSGNATLMNANDDFYFGHGLTGSVTADLNGSLDEVAIWVGCDVEEIVTPPCASSSVVVTEAELKFAIDCYNAQAPAGTYDIEIGADIAVVDGFAVTQADTSYELLIDGAGYRLTGEDLDAAGDHMFSITGAAEVTFSSIELVGANDHAISGSSAAGRIHVVNSVIADGSNGVVSFGSPVRIINSTISGHSDGGVLIDQASGTLSVVSNSTIANNQDYGAQGGSAGELILANTTVADNGHGVSNVTMLSSVLLGNATDCFQVVDDGFNYTSTTASACPTTFGPYTALYGALSDRGCMNLATPLMSGCAKTVAVSPSSEASNGGWCSSVPIAIDITGSAPITAQLSSDQRGYARQATTPCDAGAFEAELPECSGVVGWWSFDSANPGGYLQDVGQFYMPGVESGGASQSVGAGIVGDAESFTTAGSFRVDGVNFGIDATGSGMTAESWFQTTSQGSAVLIDHRAQGGGTVTDSGFLVMLWSPTQVLVQTATATGNFANRIITTPTSMNDGAWHRVTVSIGATAGALYLDGVLAGTFTTADTMRDNSSQTLFIGQELDGTDSFLGLIDEVKIWNQELTATQVAGCTPDLTPPPPPTCNGLATTHDMNVLGVTVFVGTSGDDVILGTPGDDVIVALDGDDVVCAGGGDDTVRGGPGADWIDGEAGEDTIRGAGGGDTVYGSDGDDVLDGQGGADTMYGGAGEDLLSGRGAPDTIFGGDDDDTIVGQNGVDTIDGGDGNDVIKGQTGADVLKGGPGDDDVFGGNGNDTLYGDGGTDRCAGNLGPADEAEAASCEATPGVEVLF